MSSPRLCSTLAAALIAVLALAGCGSTTPDKPDGSGSASSADRADGADGADGAITASAAPQTDDGVKTIAVTISGDKITPEGDRVQIEVGTPVRLTITADKAGELHVHSTPEQHVEFDEGTSSVELTFDKPGVVDVEDHALDKLILQFEVR